jgi:hypothetical protein
MSQNHSSRTGSKPFDPIKWLKIKPRDKPSTLTNSRSGKNPKPDLIFEKIRVRRSKKIEKWVTTDESCTEITGQFACGLMEGVTFNNRASPMNLFGQITDADAICEKLLVVVDSQKGHFKKPSGATYTARIYYAPSKGGIAIRNSDFVVRRCDFVLLNPDGTSTACWYIKPEDAPPQEVF